MFPALWIAAGAAAMYFFDPDRGSARRNRFRGKVDEFKTEHPELVQTAEAKTVVLRDRAQGFIEPIKAKIQEKIDPESAAPAGPDAIDAAAAGTHKGTSGKGDNVTDMNAKRAA